MQYEVTEYVLKKGKEVLIVSTSYEEVKNMQFLRGGQITKLKVMKTS